MNKGKWTKEEIEYLKEKYGDVSIPTIAKNLGRSETAVINKAKELNMGNFLEQGDYIVARELLKILGYSGNSNYVLNKWINKYNFPVFYKKVIKQSVKVINLGDFWEWAKKNKDRIDFSKFETGSIGAEPVWARHKREKDKKNISGRRGIEWSEQDKQKLSLLLKTHKYTWEDLGKEFNKTPLAIKSQAYRLGIKDLALSKECTPFSKDELEILKNHIPDITCYEDLLVFLPNKTTTKIRRKLYSLYGTSKLDDVKEFVRREQYDRV